MERDNGMAPSTSKVQVLVQRVFMIRRRFLDMAVPWRSTRWIALVVSLILYLVRMYYLQGFYIVTYGLGIYLLNLALVFLTPLSDPEEEDNGSALPMNAQEYKPFVRMMPEFKVWHMGMNAIMFATLLTFFDAFDVPVFWPILLFYFLLLFFLTMKKKIQHMIKHRYVPWSGHKKTYVAKEEKK